LNEFRPHHGLRLSGGRVGRHGARTRGDRLAEEVGDLVLGERWREVLVALMEVPAANKPTEPAELEALAFTLAERLSEWLKEFGFEVFDRDGDTNFMVLNPMQWHLNARL
jgi:hypothetical protein